MRSITALSIANDAIRAAVIADPYSDLPTIKHFQAIPLPNGAVVDGEVVDHDVVAGLLNTLVKRFKFPREDTALVYSSRRMVFRETDFPYMSLNDLKSTLPFQAKGMIPLPIEESELDFVPLNVIDSEQGKQLHGILVATLRNGLEKTARTAEDAGFVITSIDAGPFALARLFADTNQQQTEAVVNISGNGTDVIVLENGQPAYMRVVPSGADDVTDAIANALSISFEDAERIKNQIGLQNVTGDERLEKAEEVIRETTAQLIVGIRNTLNLYDVDHAGGTISGGDTLHITDYKHGQGVVVEAEGNPQMMLYALGALKRYTPVFGDKIKRVSMAIVQPRVTQDVKECEMTVDELLAWGENVVKPAAQKAFNGEGEFCAGAHCKFCRGRDVCPARAKLNTALEDFKDCITPDKAQNPLDPAARKVLGLPPVLTDAEVGDLLTRGANLVEWYEGLRSYALQAILDGKEIPGYKVVEGRSVRAFRDTDAALQKLMDSGFDKAVIYDYEPKTLAQLEKIVGAKRFAELLGDQIVKPKGKATLTDEKDPRAAYSSAVVDFAGVVQDG